LVFGCAVSSIIAYADDDGVKVADSGDDDSCDVALVTVDDA
jgi:hypothetical protein